MDASDPDADANPSNNPTDGSSVTNWKDRSGRGNDAATLAGQNPGVYASAPAASVNGQPTLRFNRVSDTRGTVFDVPGVDIRPIVREDVTMFAVYRPRTLSMNNGVFGNDNGDWDRFFLSYIPFFGNGVNDGIASLGPTQRGVVVPGAGIPNTVRLMTLAYDGKVTGRTNQGPTAGSAVYFNGEVVRRFTDSSDPSDAQRSLRIGWDGDNSVFDGDIAEVIVYDRVLTNEELRDVNQYLSVKYSFPVAAPLTAPGAPTNLVATPSSGSSQVAFEAGSDGGSPITNYQYSLDDGLTWESFSPADATSPVTIPGLVDGTTYAVRLRAVNAVGSGPASEPVMTVYALVPDAPVDLAAVAGAGDALVAFRDGHDGGSPITGYEYSLDGTNWNPLPAETSSPVLVPGLTNATRYSIWLRAVNAVGPGASSLPVTVTPVAGPELPGPPIDLVATRGDGSAAISFTPGSDGGSPITNYEYSTDGGLTWTSVAPDDPTSPVVISGLANGTTYEVVLRATNTVGTGIPSEVVTVTPAAVPTAPTSLIATPSSSAAVVSFTTPASDGGSPITNYEYSVDDGSTWQPFEPAQDTSPVEVSGLTNGVTASILLRAVNDVGPGAPSTPVSVRPEPSVNQMPAWTDTTLSQMVRGRPFVDSVRASGDAPMRYLLLPGSGRLPTGLTLDPATGSLSGTPTSAGPYDFTLIATNDFGFVEHRFTGTVAMAPTWSDTNLGMFTKGAEYNDGVAATALGNSPGTGAITYSVAWGLLPAGLALNPATGAITGTPTTAGSFDFTLAATNQFGSVTHRVITTILEQYRVAGTIRFVIYQPALLADGRSELDRLAASVPSDATNVRVQITGWAEARRQSSSAIALAERRSRITEEELRRRGLNATFTTSSPGRYPFLSGPTGRRAEVVITFDAPAGRIVK